MGNDPRWVPPGALVEVTQKAIHGRYLLRPSRDLVEIFNGVLIRAAQRYPVQVCAFTALSNHTHLLLIPEDWPGPSSTEALLTGRTVRGVWFDRSAEYEARRCNRRFSKYEFAEVNDLELAPIPSWGYRSAAHRQARAQELAREITAETRERIEKIGRAPLGVKQIHG